MFHVYCVSRRLRLLVSGLLRQSQAAPARVRFQGLLLVPWIAVIAAMPCPVWAQHVPVGDPLEDYLRVMEITGRAGGSSIDVRPLRATSLHYAHPWSDLTDHYEAAAGAAEFELGLFDPVVRSYRNSSRPWGMNDGDVWQGRGLTAAATAGIFARYRFLSIAARPTIVSTENADFDLSQLPVDTDLAPYGYPIRTDIDLPQRYGSNSFSDIMPGESYVEATHRGFSAGFSTENLWWGPGLWNSIVMSNNAPGFPHAYVRTARPADIRIGTIEGSWIWGSVGQTDYFPVDLEDESSADRRFLTGLTFAYHPQWISGLDLGLAQTFMVRSNENRRVGDFFEAFNIPVYGKMSARDDNLISLFARWALPRSGFEVYGEWARAEKASNFRELFLTPDHGRGFTLGFQKVYEISPRYMTRIAAEHTFLEANREAATSDSFRIGTGYFYTHENIRQGYTHGGQVIGAAIGPGSQGQFLRVDLFGPFGRVGVHLMRSVFDNDLYYRIRKNNYEHQVDIAGGLTWFFFYKRFQLGGSLTRIRTYNRDFVFENDTDNTNLQMSLRYALGYR